MHSFAPARTALVACLFVWVYFSAPAWAASESTTASRVFAAVSPSIVVVKAFDKNGHAIALGSGVVIAQGVVISNCHVFESTRTASASVFYQTHRFPATLRYGDPEHDLCSFTVKGLAAPQVKMGSAAALEVGENVYAIGAPEGLDLTLSSGIVSSLRKVPGGVLIQTTAPISPGSSGGGLFDSEARLIGITAFYAKEGQQLNFALPAEWITELPARGRKIQELAALSANTRAALQKGAQSADLLLSVLGKAAAQGDAESQYLLGLIYFVGRSDLRDYAKARYWLGKAAAQGHAGAQYRLGQMYARGDGVQQDFTKARYWYGKAAAKGDADVQYILGVMYEYGLGGPQDYAKARYWYGKAAAQGHAGAQYSLGVLYIRGKGVQQDSTKARYWCGKAAAQGFADAQLRLGLMYELGLGGPQEYAKARYWYDKAAVQASTKAPFLLGALYWHGQGVPENYVQAAKWFIIGKAEGDKKDSGAALSGIEKTMTPAQIAEAQRLADQWWKAHHKKSTESLSGFEQ
jgi:TPR repeat protein